MEAPQINYELLQIAEMYHDEMVGSREHTMIFKIVESAIIKAKKSIKNGKT